MTAALLALLLSAAPPTWEPPVGWDKFSRLVLKGDANVRVILGHRCVELEAYGHKDWAFDATSRPIVKAGVTPLFKGQLGKRARHARCASLVMYLEKEETLVQLVYVFASNERRGHYTVGRRLRIMCGNLNCPPGNPEGLFEDE